MDKNHRWLQILENKNNNQIIEIIIYKSTVLINPSKIVVWENQSNFIISSDQIIKVKIKGETMDKISLL